MFLYIRDGGTAHFRQQSIYTGTFQSVVLSKIIKKVIIILEILRVLCYPSLSRICLKKTTKDQEEVTRFKPKNRIGKVNFLQCERNAVPNNEENYIQVKTLNLGF